MLGRHQPNLESCVRCACAAAASALLPTCADLTAVFGRARSDLVNVFEVFLPQLLLYPNPADPLNGEAAALLMRDPERYAERVRASLRQPGTRRSSDSRPALFRCR